MYLDHRGFNDAVNGFLDDGWSILGSDGVEDVTIAINSNPGKFVGSQYNNTLSMLPTFGGVLCAKASMLLQVLHFLHQYTSSIKSWSDIIFYSKRNFH